MMAPQSEQAMAAIEGADKMTRLELYNAIKARLSTEVARASGSELEKLNVFSGFLPPNAESFGKYLRDAGVKVYNSQGIRREGRSVPRRNQI